MMTSKLMVAAVMLAAAIAANAAVRNDNPKNSILVWEDSARVDSTETVRMTAAWVDNGGQMTLLVEARDDSIAGLASDSASVSIEMYQLWPVRKGDVEYFVRLPSRAHPDSTTSRSAGSARYMLWDSLHIASMDTQAVWSRNARPFGDFGDSLKAQQPVNTMGAFAYKSFSPDYSPAIEFVLKGNKANAKRGPGSMWKLRLYQLTGLKVKGQ